MDKSSIQTKRKVLFSNRIVFNSSAIYKDEDVKYIYTYYYIVIEDADKETQPNGQIPSHRAPHVPKSDMKSKPSYINVNCNLGYQNDDVEMAVEEGVSQDAPGTPSKSYVKSKPAYENVQLTHGYLNGDVEMAIEGKVSQHAPDVSKNTYVNINRKHISLKADVEMAVEVV